MCAYQNRYFSVFNPFEKLTSSNVSPTLGIGLGREFATTGWSDQSDLYSQIREVSYEWFKVLYCQYFRRTHVSGLQISKTLALWFGSYDRLGCCGGDGGFARADITLKQSRHSLIRSQIIAYCQNGVCLRLCCLEWEALHEFLNIFVVCLNRKWWMKIVFRAGLLFAKLYDEDFFKRKSFARRFSVVFIHW